MTARSVSGLSRNRITSKQAPYIVSVRLRHVHARHFLFSSHLSAEAMSPLWFGLIV